MANSDVLDPRQQLKFAVDHLPNPTYASEALRVDVPSLKHFDTSVRPNGEIPMATGVPVDFVATSVRDGSGQEELGWAFDGRLWVDDLEAHDAGARLPQWLRACLGERCIRVEVTGERQGNAVPVRACFRVAR